MAVVVLRSRRYPVLLRAFLFNLSVVSQIPEAGSASIPPLTAELWLAARASGGNHSGRAPRAPQDCIGSLPLRGNSELDILSWVSIDIGRARAVSAIAERTPPRNQIRIQLSLARQPIAAARLSSREAEKQRLLCLRCRARRQAAQMLILSDVAALQEFAMKENERKAQEEANGPGADMTPSLARRAPQGLVRWEVKGDKLFFKRSEDWRARKGGQTGCDAHAPMCREGHRARVAQLGIRCACSVLGSGGVPCRHTGARRPTLLHRAAMRSLDFR